MKTAALLIALVLGILVAPLAADAQPVRRVLQVGILSPFTPSDPLLGVDVIRLGLRDLGYVDGETMRLEYRSSGGRDDRFPALAADLVGLKVDVIVAATVPAIRAAQRATTTIPIVMIFSSDPVRLRLVRSLARPAGNTTGLASLTFDLAPKRLELLKEALPKLCTVAVLVNPASPAVREGLSQTEVAARRLGVRVRSFEVREPTEFEMAFAAMLRERPDGLIVVPDPLVRMHVSRIVELAAKNRLPAMYSFRRDVEAGGLIAYGINYADHVRASLRYVDKILKGAKPADLPVEEPTRFELVVNLKTAKALGLRIPQSVLVRADAVIR